MTAEPFVTKVEVVEFEYTVKDWGQVTKVPTLTYKPGNTHHARAMGLRVHTDQGIIGDYVGGNAVEYAAIPAFVGVVLEERALAREVIYNRAKLALRQHARMGMGVLDIALWDLAGKYYDAPIYDSLVKTRFEEVPAISHICALPYVGVGYGTETVYCTPARVRLF